MEFTDSSSEMVDISTATSSDEAEQDLASGASRRISELSPEVKSRMKARKVLAGRKLDFRKCEEHSVGTMPYGCAEVRLQQALEGRRVLQLKSKALGKKLQEVVDKVKDKLEKKLPKTLTTWTPGFVPLGTAQHKRQRMFPRDYINSNYYRKL